MRAALSCPRRLRRAAARRRRRPIRASRGSRSRRSRPTTIIPGTKLVVKGDSFVDAQWGAATLHLVGSANGSDVDVQWPATFVDFGTMTVAVDGGKIDEVGGDVDFAGTARSKSSRPATARPTRASRSTSSLSFRNKLDAAPTSVDATASSSSTTRSRSTAMASCSAATRARRSRGSRLLHARRRRRLHADRERRISRCSPSRSCRARRRRSRSRRSSPASSPARSPARSRRQQADRAAPRSRRTPTNVDLHARHLADLHGRSAGREPRPVRVRPRRRLRRRRGRRAHRARADGHVQQDRRQPGAGVDDLIPEFVEGQLVRYVVNTDDELGHALDLRHDTGQFTGTITPIVSYGADTVRGVVAERQRSTSRRSSRSSTSTTRASYVEGLRDFGLRAVDNKIRERILEVCKQAYQASTSSSATSRSPTSRCSRTSSSSASIRTTWACSATTTRPARTTATSASTTGSAASTR